MTYINNDVYQQCCILTMIYINNYLYQQWQRTNYDRRSQLKLLLRWKFNNWCIYQLLGTCMYISQLTIFFRRRAKSRFYSSMHRGFLSPKRLYCTQLMAQSVGLTPNLTTRYRELVSERENKSKTRDQTWDQTRELWNRGPCLYQQ